MSFWPLIAELFAAVFWACASVLLFRFGTSVFRNLKRDFWNPVYSSKNARQIFGYKVDAFHLFQSAAIICFCLPIAIPHSWQVFEQWYFDIPAKLVLTCAVWCIAFPVTYGLLSPYHKQMKK